MNYLIINDFHKRLLHYSPQQRYTAQQLGKVEAAHKNDRHEQREEDRRMDIRLKKLKVMMFLISECEGTTGIEARKV